MIFFPLLFGGGDDSFEFGHALDLCNTQKQVDSKYTIQSKYVTILQEAVETLCIQWLPENLHSNF